MAKEKERKEMRRIVKMSLAASMLMGVSSVSLEAADILTNIKADGQIRARYEMADVKNDNKDNAHALTNRLMLGVGADIAGQDWISAYVQMTNVSAAIDKYSNEDKRYSVVGDPKQTRLTQSYVDLKYNKTLLRAGRQVVALDNQRFVSAVDWRQMFQSFDAIAVVDNSIENLNIVAGYVTQVNGFDATPGTDTRSIVLNASYKVMPELKITVYDYMIGAGTGATDAALKANSKAGLGQDNYGMALTGDIGMGDGNSLNYRAEYAKQKAPTLKLHSSASKSRNMSAKYFMLEANADIQGFLAGVQYEVMGGAKKAGDSPFLTPLTTRHGFNGWADAFVPGSMPEQGLRDLNFTLGYKSDDLGMFKINYRDFKSDKGSFKYGTEWDAIYTRAIPGVQGLSGMLKFAKFNAKESQVAKAALSGNGNYGSMKDTTKFWAMLDYKFSTK